MAQGEIFWAGYNGFQKPFRVEFESVRKIRVVEREHADESLDVIVREPYSLIVVEPHIVAGSKRLPGLLEDVLLGDYGGISRYVVESVRASDENYATPIIVPYFPKPTEQRTNGVVAQFMKAGATECVRIGAGEEITSSPQKFAEYLISKYNLLKK